MPEEAMKRGPAGRVDDLDAQFEKVKPDFGGKSELLFYLYCCVIRARRGVDPVRQAEIIRYAFLRHGETLYRDMNTRWLVSFLNTIADHGARGEAEAARALTTFVHMIKIYESLFLTDPQKRRKEFVDDAVAHSTAHKPFREPANFPKIELWDYMFMMALDTGDVIDNLYNRLEDKRYPFVAGAFRFVCGQLAASETVYAEILRINRFTNGQVQKPA
ncbi:hypothetical protein [Hyphococcus sp.]|uniref:hypothetical protein n=1 Tax=Hyphococcus sp. TaxID=2038636 RepID=UPI003753D462